MTRYAALLRGIGPSNPNMHNARLREVCEGLGLRNVVTVASSGNIVFDSDDTEGAELEARLEAAWPRELGFRSTSILRTADELVALRDLAPFGDREHGKSSYLLVTFAKRPVVPATSMSPPPAGTAFTVVGAAQREIFTVTDTTRAGSPDTMTWLERAHGRDITSRTWPAVLRILNRCAP